MCGIVGYVGAEPALPIVLEGLRRLEYRGYDSAGVAIVDGTLAVTKRAGKLAELEAALDAIPAPGGMARSGSATRGGPPTARRATPTRTRTSTARDGSP
jgi:glucosamine--fructose-6-phosphate aminotransferase (isomerizing)